MDRAVLLESLDLSPSEARAYLCVLEAGEIKISEIAKVINVTRMAAYNAVNSLLKKNLVTETVHNNRRFVSAQDPQQLLARLDYQRLKLKTNEDQLRDILPDLSSLFSASKTKPSVRVFNGKKGLKAAFLEVVESLKHSESYCYLGPLEEVVKYFGPEYMEFARKQVDKKIKIRGIAATDEFKRERAWQNSLTQDIRVVSKESLPFNNVVLIYRDKVAIVSFQDENAVTIQSPKFATTMQSFFEIAWVGAEKIG